VFKLNSNIIIVAVIMVLALGLRAWHYGQYPGAGETKDEYAWSWLGESLLAGNPPTSWSWFGHYKNSELVIIDNNPYRIVSPVFDNPPLFSLIPGAMMRLKGVHGIQAVSTTLIRWPMILLGAINVGLVYGAVLVWRNRKQALIASLLMATIPTMVLGSRMVLAENLLTTFMLLAIIGLGFFQKTNRSGWLVVTAVAAGLCVLTKVSGLFVPAAIFTYMLMLKQKEAAVKLALISAGVAGLWLGYALYYGFDVFWASLTAQASLPIGWGSIPNLFIRLHIVDKAFVDGWIMLGLLLLFWKFFKPSDGGSAKVSPFLLLFMFWLLFHVAAVGEQNWHGWYKYPLFPLMVAEMAGWLDSRKFDLKVLIPFYLFGLLGSVRLLSVMMDVRLSSWPVRLGIAMTLALFIASYSKRVGLRQRKFVYWLMISLFVIINALVILNLTPSLVEIDGLNFFPVRIGI
jgi:4-amino-4-deoxy-L-arabinose transferase-like glycosyltransferase